MKNTAIILIVVILVVLIVLGVVFYQSQGKKSTASQAPGVPTDANGTPFLTGLLPWYWGSKENTALHNGTDPDIFGHA